MAVQVVILAGGLATRMRPATDTVPKSLLPVRGRPFILHQLELLQRSGLARTGPPQVLLCVGHLGQMIREVVGDGSQLGVSVRYSWEDPTHLLGTGGALVNALPHLAEEFLVLYGDSYLRVDYAAVAAAFRAQSRPAMMCVFRNEGRWDASNVRLAPDPGGEGPLVALYSKQAQPGEADWIDYGLSALRRDVVARWRDARMPLDLAVIYGQLAQEGALAAYEVTERFYEIGKPEGLAELERELAAQEACGGGQ